MVIHIGTLKIKCSRIVAWCKIRRIEGMWAEGESKIYGGIACFSEFSEEKRICAAPGRGGKNRNKPLGHILDLNLGSPS